MICNPDLIPNFTPPAFQRVKRMDTYHTEGTTPQRTNLYKVLLVLNTLAWLAFFMGWLE